MHWLTERGADDLWVHASQRFMALILACCFWALASMLLAVWRTKLRPYPKAWMLLFMATIFVLCGLSRFFDWLELYWPVPRLYAAYDLILSFFMMVALPFEVITAIELLRVPDPGDIRHLRCQNEALHRGAEVLKREASIKQRRIERLHKAVQILRITTNELKGNTSLEEVIKELEAIGVDDARDEKES